MTLELKAGQATDDRRLDRVPQFDPGSRDYNARVRLYRETGSERPPYRSYTWANRFVSNQGEEGACVGHGHGGRVVNGPVAADEDLDEDRLNGWCEGLYKEAQQLDEWPGTDYSGSSVLGGAKACKARGYYTEYRWAFSIEDVLLSIMYLGPVVLGISWLEGMDDPRPSGLVRATGAVRGGHCIRARGVRLRAQLPGEIGTLAVVRLTNSWGRGYGVNGDVYLPVEDLEALLGLDGECCVPTEPGQHRVAYTGSSERPATLAEVCSLTR
jgi:hypothetical protein